MQKYALTRKRYYEKTKALSNARSRKWGRDHPERVRASARKFREKNPDKSRKAAAKWRAAQSPEVLKRGRRVQTLQTYGLTVSQYDEMLAAQDDCCAICGTLAILCAGKGDLHVDHDHKTKKVRGLLCHHCNTGLGLFQDNPLILKSATAYLLRDVKFST
jgi:hypothetical protein